MVSQFQNNFLEKIMPTLGNKGGKQRGHGKQRKQRGQVLQSIIFGNKGVMETKGSGLAINHLSTRETKGSGLAINHLSTIIRPCPDLCESNSPAGCTTSRREATGAKLSI